MAVSLVGTPGVAYYSSPNTTSASVTTDAGTQVGDVLLLAVTVGKKAAVTATPSGWTLLLDKGVGGNSNPVGHLLTYTKVATVAGAQTVTVTNDIGAAQSLELYTLRGANTPTVGGSANTVTSTTINTSSFSTAEDAQLILRIAGYVQPNQDNSASAWTASGSPVGTKLATAPASGTSSINGITSMTESGPTPAGTVAARTLTFPLQFTAIAIQSLLVPALPTGAPAATTAPAVTGTAAVGQVLTCDGGTWNQPLTGRTYQWQTDASGSFANISGATSSTYTVVAGDAGHALRCVVTASTTSNGSGTANSNSTAIPAPPVNTAAPVIATSDGSAAATGKTLVLTTPGTYNGAVSTRTYQWYRGSSPITGQTDQTGYVLVQSDEGASITLQETASNGGGSAPAAASNAITPPVTAPLSDASFLNYLSGGAGNTSGAASIGGARGGTYDGSLNSLIGPIPGSVAQAGGTFYRIVYVRNTHASASAVGLKLFVENQFTAPGLQLAVAVPTEAANTPVAALTSGTTAPTGVTWTTTTDPAQGADFGTLAAGAYRGVHVRVTVAPGTPLTPEADAGFAADGAAG